MYNHKGGSRGEQLLLVMFKKLKGERQIKKPLGNKAYYLISSSFPFLSLNPNRN